MMLAALLGSSGLLTAGPLQYAIPSSGSSASLLLRQNGGSIELLDVPSGAVVATAPLASTDAVVVLGVAGAHDDTLTIDFSGGPLALPGGISFDGGTGGFDTLVLKGGSFSSETVDVSGPGSGTITLDSTVVSYANLEPVTSTSAALVFNVNVSGAISVQNGPSVSGFSTTVISSPTSAFESQTFANKAAVTVTCTTITTACSFDVNNPSGSTGLVSMSFIGSVLTGADTFKVVPGPVPYTVTGGGPIYTAVPGDTLTIVPAGATGISLTAPAPPIPVTSYLGTWTFSNRSTIVFSGIETITPVITSTNAATFTVGTSGTFTATALARPSATFSESGALPSGVTLTSAGVLSGTPAAGTGGVYPFTLTASNGRTPDATQAFTLTVNEAPAITSAATTTFTAGSIGSFNVTTTGYPARTFSSSGTLPAGVTLNAGSGLLGGTPSAGTGGSYPISITASNGVTPNAVQNFTLVVNQAPAITSPASASFSIGAPGSFTVTTTGYPARTFSASGTLPAGVTLNAATGLLAGTPAPGSEGTYPFTITASNGVSPAATQAFSLLVSDFPPVGIPGLSLPGLLALSAALAGAAILRVGRLR